MSKSKWAVVAECYTQIEAEILRGFLEAQGFTAQVSQEAYGNVLGLTIAPGGQIEILVPSEQEEAVKSVLDDYADGKFEEPEL